MNDNEKFHDGHDHDNEHSCEGHHHSHEHDHNHHHIDVSEVSAQKLFWVILLNFGITLAEIIGGIVSGSLSLISDALHNFSDAIAVIISYIALKLSQRKNSLKHTFGLKRAEILAALLNSSVLIGISVFLFYEAVKRFYHPEPIMGSTMLIIAIIGLAGNLLSIYFLDSGAHDNMNIKSAYLHMLSDAISSVAVILGAIGIIFFKIYWIDPVLTILIGIYVLYESFKILKKSVHILMEGTPVDISIEKIKEAVESIDGLKNVHHIHIWSVGEKDIFFEAHAELEDMMLSEAGKVRQKVENKLIEFGVNHITLQLEVDECAEKEIICG
ncbi:cation transporter [Deferribacteraceae bacterium V6Fe1]|nr:cation transporter [Deferribacteraceae bacterium V6Fe1]